MILFRLAYRNLVGAGLRTWLNVFVLSISYVLIIWHQGLFSGMLRQGTRAMIDDDIAGGQFWHQDYDPLDVFSLDDSHGRIPAELVLMISQGQATAILVRQAAIFPQGRIQSVILKGITPEQTVLSIPSLSLKTSQPDSNILPVLIGKRMAKNASLQVGDELIIRWRDDLGTFDAIEGTVVKIMDTDVPTIDMGHVWVPLDRLQSLNRLDNEATIVTIAQTSDPPEKVGAWIFRDQKFLLSNIQAMVDSKRVGSFVMYSFLLFLAMLTIFDTQVLSIFKRRREIGTLVALGMTRRNVMFLFTLEGAMNGLLALGLGAMYGFPLLVYTSRHGLAIPISGDNYGFALSNVLYPSYSAFLVITTICIVFGMVTLVSFLPTRQISRLNPTDALKGKFS